MKELAVLGMSAAKPAFDIVLEGVAYPRAKCPIRATAWMRFQELDAGSHPATDQVVRLDVTCANQVFMRLHGSNGLHRITGAKIAFRYDYVHTMSPVAARAYTGSAGEALAEVVCTETIVVGDQAVRLGMISTSNGIRMVCIREGAVPEIP